MELSSELSNSDQATLIDRVARALHRSSNLYATRDQSPDQPHAASTRIRFAELPQAQREAYRTAARTLLNTLNTLDVYLEAPQEGASVSAEDAEEQTLADLANSTDPFARREAWRAAGPEQRRLQDCRELARDFLARGEPLIAYDILSEGRELWPEDLELRQLTAHALSRAGASGRAKQILRGLYEEGHHDGETLGMLASSYKDLAGSSRTEAERLKRQKQALSSYEAGYRIAIQEGRWQAAYYTGINVATLAMLTGDHARSREVAQRVQQICLDLLETTRSGPEAYWTHATLGEASLLLGEWERARAEYAEAARIGTENRRPAHLNATRRQAHMILDHLGEDRSLIDQLFQAPRLTVFTGHMVDHPNRKAPRFPAELEPEVKGWIDERLDAIEPDFGYASAACGSDILFLEAMLERKAEIHIVLPCPAEEFRRASVAFTRSTRWNERFNEVLKEAKSVYEVGMAGALENPLAFEYASRIVFGLGLLRAEQLGAEVAPVAVWDGKTNHQPGGAAETLRFWKSKGFDPDIISLPPSTSSPSASSGSPAAPQPDRAGEATGQRAPGEGAGTGATERDRRDRDPPALDVQSRSLSAEKAGLNQTEIVAVLFADAVRFSWLNEAQTTAFVKHYLGTIARLNESTEHKPSVTNTWGDGLFMVFPDIRSAGLYAIELADRMSGQKQHWRENGLPETLDIRIGLHAGPAFAVYDPVKCESVYFGSHVSWASRLEPVTPPGSVYASRAFAALAAAERITDFACEYVGQTPLAKNRGTFPTYALRHRAE